MSINRTYHTWFDRIRQLRPRERKTRVRNMAWLTAGIFESRSVHLSKITRRIPSTAMAVSITRRLSNFLKNKAVRVRDWYEPIAKDLLVNQARSGSIRLIVDGTKVGFGHQLLMVAIAYRKRALPIAWTWVPSNRGHSSAYKQMALLSYVHRLIPADAQVLVVGDSEFGAVDVLKMLDSWHWGYVLRQKASHSVKTKGRNWQPFGNLVQKAGQSLWLEDALLTQQHAYGVNLLAYWRRGEKEPWLLATNLRTSQMTLLAYKRRMWIEEMFGDFKKHGFDLESSHLQHFMRLSRLTLAVVLLYVWLVSFGSQTIKNGKRRSVDRSDRRDLSIFRIGCNILDRCLSNSLPFSIPLVPYS